MATFDGEAVVAVVHVAARNEDVRAPQWLDTIRIRPAFHTPSQQGMYHTKATAETMRVDTHDQVGAIIETFTMVTPVHHVGTMVQNGWLIMFMSRIATSMQWSKRITKGRSCFFPTFVPSWFQC